MPLSTHPDLQASSALFVLQGVVEDWNEASSHMAKLIGNILLQ